MKIKCTNLEIAKIYINSITENPTITLKVFSVLDARLIIAANRNGKHKLRTNTNNELNAITIKVFASTGLCLCRIYVKAIEDSAIIAITTILYNSIKPSLRRFFLMYIYLLPY
jgi:hypothetical protein